MSSNLEFQGFNEALLIRQPTDFGSPVFKKSDGQDLYERVIRLKDIGGDAGQSWDRERQVWIVSHGWNETYGWYGADLGKSIKAARPQDIVLGVDWEEAARTTIISNPIVPGANDILGILSSAPFYAGTWIGVVADAIAEQLAAWGIKNEAVNLIGHSLGTQLNNEIAYRLMNTYASQTGGGKVKSLTVLDPASDNVLVRPQENRFLEGYAYPREIAPQQFEYVSAGTLQYQDLASFSRAFLAKASIAGSVDLAASADEAFIVEYNTLDPTQHN